MSYILEALRRAERERNPAQTPEVRIISDASGARIAPPRTSWPWLAGGLLLAFGCGGLLVVALLRPAPADPAPSASVPPVTAEAAAPLPAPATVSDLSDPSDPRQLDDLVDPEAGLSELPPEPELLPEEPLPDTSPVRSAPAPRPADTAAPAAAPYEPEIEAFEMDPAPVEPDIPALKDMPPEFRADFPRLNLDVHFYEDDVARRFVMLNGRRYREGDTLREGPQLQEITSDGLVLSHRGRQVFLPALN